MVNPTNIVDSRKDQLGPPEPPRHFSPFQLLVLFMAVFNRFISAFRTPAYSQVPQGRGSAILPLVAKRVGKADSVRS